LLLQTTLLGLAIAIILALVAALVGPFLIDWGTQRALFESQASRLVGLNVRVKGPIEARLLPSPRLTLHEIAIGDGAGTIRARALGVEFALGPLMRGEWRAAQMQLAGPQISVGLDSSGHIRAPALAVAFKPDELSVDRLSIEDGTITLTDAASNASVALSRVRFNGEARSFLGPLKGEGAVTVAGQSYPYRIAVGRLTDQGTLKLHLNVDPVDRSLSVETDGALTLTAGEPRFDGTLSLSRPVGIDNRSVGQAAQAVTQPWRVTGKIKATAEAALMDNAEFQYGSEEQGFKLNGVANFAFGKRPHFDAVLSGRQIDLDRAISGADGTRQLPATVIRKLAELGKATFPNSLPIKVGIGIDQITLGGNIVQNLRGDVISGPDGWKLDRFEFRAPGMTQVRLSGRLDVKPDGVAFRGPAEVDASDPKMLTAWLEGRNETSQGDLRPITARGDVALAGDKIAVESLKLEFDRKPVSGRLAYVFPSGTTPARLDAEVKAAQFDVDAAVAFGKALLAGSAIERPRDITLAADVERATFAGFEARDARAQIKIDATGLQLDRMSVGDFAGTSFTATGRVETNGHAPRGNLALDLEVKQTAAIRAAATRVAPKEVESIVSLLDRLRSAKLHAALDVAADDKSPIGTARLTVVGDLDDAQINARAQMSGDLNAPGSADLRIDATADAPQSSAVIKLTNLDWLLAVGNGPGQLKVQASGPANGDMAFALRLSADGLSAQADGKGRLFDGQGLKAVATLRVAAADLRPLRGPTGPGSSLPMQMTSRVTVTGGAVKFDAIDAKLAGSGIRGRLAVDDASPHQIDGAIESDTADVPALLARAIGLQPQGGAAGSAWGWSSEPFGGGVLGKLNGKVTLKVDRARILAQITARALKTTLRFSKDELALDDIAGEIAAGRLSGSVAFHSAEDGLATRARVSLARADVASLLSATARPAVTGLLDLTAEVDGAGLSPITLIGSLKGSGKVALSNGRMTGLDARSFNIVTRAVDQGLPIETSRISDLMGKSLDGGQLLLKSAESVMQISAGQLRLNDASAQSKDAAVSIAGTLDLTDGSMDAQLVLSGSDEAAGARPNIFVALKGPITAPARSIDVSALTGWLTLRAVENQTKRLRAIENVPVQPRGRGMPNTKQAPALPAPIDIRRAPAPRSAGQPAASVRSQN
jgi:uncharacterized protein involved in outer membrane biogenesis